MKSTQDSAIEVASSANQLRALSTTQFDVLRNYVLSDSYVFAKVVCGHADLVPSFHAPLSYVLCGLPSKLAATLDDPAYDGYVTRLIRRELWRRGIDWRTPGGMVALDALLDFVNVRVYRGSFKSSVGTHAGVLWSATRDPNETIWIVSSTDENAWAFCEQIGETIEDNPAYMALFGDRIPANLKEAVTQRRITLEGRTISHPQTTIEADGYQTRRISAHFSQFWIDDLVVKENASPVGLKSVKSWLSGLTGFEMDTRRMRRVHLGTIWDENDDYRFLTNGKLAQKCLSLLIPIELHEEGWDGNILERGKPTNPSMTAERVQNKQDKVLGDEEEGPVSWRCNYLLDPTAGDGRLFPRIIVHDPERSYVKLPHPKQADAGRFLVSRLERDKEGKKIEVENYKGPDDSPARYKWLTLDPMRDLDRVFTLDPSWVDGGDNWAISCTGDDHDAIRFQLETVSGDDGVEGWIDALPEMVAFWRPRSIGFDKSAVQDAAINQIIKTDKRLRHIRHLFVPVSTKNQNKKARIRQFVAEPLKIWKLLLDPDDTVTKDEMTDYRGTPNATDGILDSLAMAPAIHVGKSSREVRQERANKLAQRSRYLDRMIDPYTGVPYAA